ncbi:MAG: SDR family NAD(P)-dependent oxidoreductase [Pseudomonadota bacterium]|nr:SDR family NAD(P)-dependent oxidoreductase [Pseudomonadota bacterium]
MSTPRKPLTSQVVVITGATSCIGLATARMAARHGALLMLAASNATTLARLASELRQAGGKVEAFPVDVTVESDVTALGSMAVQRFGRVDTWINAGMAMDDADDGDDVKPAPVASRLFKAHYWGAAHGSNVAKRLMRDGGTIINLDSLASARHGVKGCTDALRAAVEADGMALSVTLIHAARTGRADMHDAPHLVAEAILHAAQYAQRDVVVGGAAHTPAPRNRLAPRLLEKCMDFIGLRHAPKAAHS